MTNWKIRSCLRFDRKAAEAALRKHGKLPETELSKRIREEDGSSEAREEYDKKLENEETLRQKKESRKEKRRCRLARGVQIVLALLSAYTVFLLYGLIVTEYEYNENGMLVPRIITTDEIENKAVFEQIYRYYIQARILYEDILRLDYKLTLENETKLLATEYEALLDDVSKLVVSIDALAVDTKYGQFKTMLLEWVKTDAAVYLQNMSAAILQNSSEKGNEAIAGRNKMYSDFMLLSENVAALGETISGVDISSMYEWSPEQYVKEVLEGVQKNE